MIMAPRMSHLLMIVICQFILIDFIVHSTVVTYSFKKHVTTVTAANTEVLQGISGRVRCSSICLQYPLCQGFKTENDCHLFYEITNQIDNVSTNAVVYLHEERLLSASGWFWYDSTRMVKKYIFSKEIGPVTHTWNEALELCNEPIAGGILFVPHNVDDVRYLNGMLQYEGATEVYFGLTDEDEEVLDDFSRLNWMDGTPFDFGIFDTALDSENWIIGHNSEEDHFGRFKFSSSPPIFEIHFKKFDESKDDFICQRPL